AVAVPTAVATAAAGATAAAAVAAAAAAVAATAAAVAATAAVTTATATTAASAATGRRDLHGHQTHRGRQRRHPHELPHSEAPFPNGVTEASPSTPHRTKGLLWPQSFTSGQTSQTEESTLTAQISQVNTNSRKSVKPQRLHKLCRKQKMLTFGGSGKVRTPDE